MPETTTIPSGGMLSTLSFLSEILGDYDTFSKGMIAWGGKDPEDFFCYLCWDDNTHYVEVVDGAEPRTDAKTGRNAVYTIFGYCRYQGIYHSLLGANLPSLKNEAARNKDSMDAYRAAAGGL
jgi:hypothetical protein